LRIRQFIADYGHLRLLVERLLMRRLDVALNGALQEQMDDLSGVTAPPVSQLSGWECIAAAIAFHLTSRAHPMTQSETAFDSTQRSLRVWDLPTRLFHWSLLALLLVSWFSGGEEDTAFIHRTSGMLLAGLIIFRIVWGFVGGEHARFGSFFPSPSKIIEHLKRVAAGNPERHLGHNPVGGVAVFLLLATVSACIITGLFSSGEGLSGPFAGSFGLNFSEIHELAFRALQGLVVLHLLGVAVESWLARDALVPAMITGRKSRNAGESGEHAAPASLPAFAAALAAGAAVTGILWTLPTPPAVNEDQRDKWGEYEDHRKDPGRDRDSDADWD